jgi:hypothetical protein
MTTTTTMTTTAHAVLARRKALKALRLRLAIRKAESMEASYGADLARPFWKAVGEAEKAIARHIAPQV